MSKFNSIDQNDKENGLNNYVLLGFSEQKYLIIL